MDALLAFLAGCLVTSLVILIAIWLALRLVNRISDVGKFSSVSSGFHRLNSQPLSASSHHQLSSLRPRQNSLSQSEPSSNRSSRHASVEDLVLARLQDHQQMKYDASAFIRRSNNASTVNSIPWSSAKLLLHYAHIVNLPPNYFYIQLHRTTLSFHDQDGCVDTISMTNYSVRLVPDDLRDFEYYSKLFPIELTPLANGGTSTLYLFFCTSSEKEDWYLRLLFASRKHELNWPQSPSFSSMLNTSDTCIHNGNWMHQLTMRLFENFYMRETIINRLTAIIQQRLKRAPKSPFLRAIMLKDIRIEHLPLVHKFTSAPRAATSFRTPYFYCNAHLDWQDSPLTITVDATFTFDSILTLVEVPATITINLHSISGEILLWMKPPPSNRLWFGFHPPGPQFDFDVLPTVAGIGFDSQWAVIRDFIKNQAMLGLQDAAVVPNGMDIGLGPGLFDEVFAENLAEQVTEQTIIQHRREPNMELSYGDFRHRGNIGL